MFRDVENKNLNKIDTSSAEDAKEILQKCASLTSINLSKFKASKAII